MMDEMIYLNKQFSDEEIKEMTKIIRNAPASIVTVAEPIVKHLKVKKDIPTVIEYMGRRYVLDHANNRK